MTIRNSNIEDAILLSTGSQKKTTENVADRKTHDLVFVCDLLDCVFDQKLDDSDVEKCTDWVHGLKANLDHCYLDAKTTT